jgi:hypothetical protein
MGLKPLCVAIVVMASVLVAAPTASAATPMGQHRAGQYYLRWVCPQNDAGARLEQILFHGRRVFHSNEITGRRLTRTKRAARHVANTQFTAARKFNNPPAAWPASVRRPVRQLSNNFVRTSGIFQRMGAARNGRQVVRTWNNAMDATRPALGRIIRARLNLPAPGRGCGH